MSLNIADMLIEPQTAQSDLLHLTVNDFDVCFRLPDSRDLAAVAAVPDQSLAIRQLFEKCIIEARHKDESVLQGQLPQAVADAVANRIAQADAQSDIELEITCPACKHSWVSLFDIATFFWSELSTETQRLLRDIHTLAMAYGWSEDTILALSPARRQAYLEMVAG